MLPRWIVFLLIAITAAALVQPAVAETRMALVVGASAYRAAMKLPNTLNDARGVEAALRRLDFDVDAVMDPDRAAFEAAVRRFGERARGADVALFYYAGHAVEVGGRNWLVPVSADIRSERDLRFDALGLDDVLEQIEGAAPLAVVVLDSCRDNPFKARLGEGGRGVSGGGLAGVRAALGTLIAFSTAPGMVAADGDARNSPFTAALLRHMEKPGLELRQMLAEVRRDVRVATQGRQVPWEQSAMEGTLYLKPAPAAPVVTVPTPVRPGPDVEMVFWESVRASADPADLRAYLARYPDGLFAELARNRVAALSGTSPSAQVLAAGPSFRDQLLARYASIWPNASAQTRDGWVANYMALPAPKALAFSPTAGGAARAAARRESAAAAEEAALENCQVLQGIPCASLAIDETVLPPGADRRWPVRDMPRARYEGRFDPAQIPGASPAIRAQRDLIAYHDVREPKAVAWTASGGRAFAVTGAPDRHAAEEQALAACAAAPERGTDPCYLYAAGDQVVLTRRLTRPTDDPYSRITAAALLAGPLAHAASYPDLRGQKALAVHVESGRSFHWERAETTERARQLVLEGCQQAYGAPCVLIAANTDLIAADPRVAPRADMPRLRYQGAYDPDQVPFLRLTPELRQYASLPGPKAIAVRPTGARAVVMQGAGSQAEAERKALEVCNSDGASSPCFLYAAGARVVLPERRTTAP